MNHWYLIAYDIRDPKRLRKLHTVIKKQAIALQYSVFLIKANDKKLTKLLNALNAIAKDDEDDIRLYPVFNPNTIWAAGRQAASMEYLYNGGKKSSPPRRHWLKSTLDRLTGVT